MRQIRFFTRIIAILLLNLLLVPPYLLLTALTGKIFWGLQGIWFKTLCYCLGMRIVTHGQPSKTHPTLYTSNHVSYLDIVVLSKLIHTIFVSKHEVAGWPVIGWLAKLRHTVFINRNKMRKSPQHCREMAARIQNDDLIFFPEGTSTDGTAVLPFKSTLFCVAMEGKQQAIQVQPIAITYLKDKKGNPLDGEKVDLYAWYADMTLGPHLLEVLKQPGVEVHVRFMEPIPVGTINDRKQLSAHVNKQVTEAVKQTWAIAGIDNPQGVLPKPTDSA